MKPIAWLFKWLLKAAIFFTLFTFALNNQRDVTLHFFFGRQWTAPLVLVVLGAFAIGLVIGILGMAPRWWRQRQSQLVTSQPRAALAENKTTTPATDPYNDSAFHGI